MKTIVKLVFVCVWLLISCKESDEEITVKSQSKAVLPAEPKWTAGFPTVRTGATSLDLIVQTENDAKVLYAISKEKLELNPDDLLTDASTNAIPAIIEKGSISVDGGTPATITFTTLSERSPYFIYTLAQNATDTIYNKTVNELDLKTKTRQDTSQYYSPSENRQVDFLIYMPEDAIKYPERKYPMSIYLAGIGEAGTRGRPINLIRSGSLPEYIHKGNDVPMIVLSIQQVTKEWETPLIHEGIEHGLKNYPADDNKISIIGTSAGAFGAIAYAQEHPERLAAIVPISGGGDNDRACTMKDISLWAFHNQHDEVVGAGRSQGIVNAVMQCSPSKEVKLQMFPDKGHNCWKRVFDPKHEDWKKSPQVGPIDLYGWIIEQKKN